MTGFWVRKVLGVMAVAAGLACLPLTAAAQDFTRTAQNETGDTAWVLTASLFTLLTILPGLALFYGGRVQAKNVMSVGLQVAAVASVVSVVWIVVGYTLAFGDTVGGIIGNGRAWMLLGLTNLRDGMTIPESTYVMFQMALAMLAAALMVGAWADRARFGWVIAFIAIWSVVVYAPVAHWLWGGGWLGDIGVVDKAGGLLVHTTAGFSALVVALLMGKRRKASSGLSNAHAQPLMLAGLLLLWIGLLARNGVPSLTATDDASSAILNTHLAAAVSALVWLLLEKLGGGKPSASGFAIGGLAGLVTVTAAADLIAPGGAVAIGIAGSLACFWSLRLIQTRLFIDDALGVFAVNGVGGMLGALLLGLFAWQGLGGTGYTAGSDIPLALGVQALGIAVVALYSAFVTAIVAVAVSLFIPMRVTEDEETEGLDMSSHGERGWNFD